VLSQLYKLFYGRWAAAPASSTPGYTLWIFLPGDMPFFFEIFRAVFGEKKTEHLVETIVVPDQVPPGLARRFDEFASAWSHGPIRMVEFQPLDRLLVRSMNNPHTINWLQLVRAVNATTTTHGLWHDADLFVLEREFFDAHYRQCAGDDLACVGLRPVWDPWYAQKGLTHVAATWEMMFNVAWIRSFLPWMHRGHDGMLLGERHTFDSTLLPQGLTPPEKVALRGEAPDFVHFNYVICTYRHFQNAKGPFEDEYFRILLIRLLINAFDTGDWKYDAPSIAELTRGITDPSNRVTFLRPETASHYDEFRTKLRRLVESPLLTPAQASRIVEGVEPFDRAFGEVAGTVAAAGH
jgi:hypothetical protein